MGMPKLTRDIIHDMIKEETYFRHRTLTICVLDLVNGAQVVGHSNVINPENFDELIGRTTAKENAVGQIWQLEGYALKTRAA